MHENSKTVQTFELDNWDIYFFKLQVKRIILTEDKCFDSSYTLRTCMYDFIHQTKVLAMGLMIQKLASSNFQTIGVGLWRIHHNLTVFAMFTYVC